jgi:DNA-3-methyladenine glycosylase II
MSKRAAGIQGDWADGFCYDPAEAVRHLTEADPVLADLISRAGPFAMRLLGPQSPFEALARNIVYQQLHGKAAAAIHARVLALSGGRRLRPEHILDTPDGPLRAAGLSASKLAALRDLAAKAADGTVPTLARLRRMGDDEIVARLTGVRGIGRWTVEMLLMFGLGRPDVLPTGDYAVRKGFAATYGLSEMPGPKEVEAFGERWRPHRSVASWYMWRALELPPKDDEEGVTKQT